MKHANRIITLDEMKFGVNLYKCGHICPFRRFLLKGTPPPSQTAQWGKGGL